MSRQPTVRRPRVDLCPWVKRVFMQIGGTELDLVCTDTGVVVYTTPIATMFKFHHEQGNARANALNAARLRARQWLKRHGLVETLPYNPKGE